MSIILLLGFSGVILIYFFGKYSGIYDYMAFRLNLMASDITGFSNLAFIILHRSFYFVAGITFLVATAFFLDRLSNQIKNKISLGIIATIFAGVACYLMVSLWAYRNDAIKLREDMVALNGQWASVPNIQILSNHLTIDHTDDQIKGTSEMRVSNTTEVTLDTLFFTLNPGLEVTQITIDQQAVDFQKELHIISIPQKNGIAPGQKSIVKMNYQGVILEEAAHLEVEQKRYETIDGEFVYAIEKRYAFLQSGYALLTKDVLWYPNNTIGYSQSSPIKESGSFIDFKLDVKAAGNTIPISQGRVEKAGDYYQFRPEYPLSQISLTIGDYEKKALVVDSISYEIYYHKGNDYFSESFNELGDTLGLLVKDLITSYEHDQQLNYPFERLQLVEAPIHFKAYNKIHVGHQAFVQPEIVFWPEKGGSNRDFDLKRQFRNMDRQARQENQVLSDKEKQANVFNAIIKKVFTKQLGDRWFFDGRDADEADYSIFPNLYAYNSGVVSDKWTFLNKGVAEYLNEVRSPENDFSRNINGISFTEECNQLMQEAPLMEVLTKETEFSRIQKSVALKGEYLFSYLEQLIGEEELKQFLYGWINSSQHRLTTYEDFRNRILNEFELDIDPIINQVYSQTDQPSFEIQNMDEYELLDGDRKRYQVLFDVTNTGNNDGVIKVAFDEENAQGLTLRRRNLEAKTALLEYTALIKAGETRQFGFVLDNEPKKFAINTLVSKNIPSIISLSPGQFILKENATPFEGEKVVDGDYQTAQYEVIVDNEDEGFSVFSPVKDTYLRAYLDKRNPSDKKYHGIWRRSYSKWRVTTGSGFHGKHIRSAHFTRSGKGEKTTEWTPDLKEEGFYDLYAFMIGKNQNQFTGRRNSDRKYTYKYIINHADGKDEINFNLSNAERGWNYLGSYYFTGEGGSVVLTDECDLRTVYADAIKWVKQ